MENNKLENVKLVVNTLISEGIVDNQAHIAKDLGYKRPQTISDILLAKVTLAPKFIKSFCSTYNVSEEFINTGEGEMFVTQANIGDDIAQNSKRTFDLSKFKVQAKQVAFDQFMEADYIPAHAQAGLMVDFADSEHVEEYEKILVPREFEKGYYAVIELSGKSMDDGTSRSFLDGDKVLVKELQRAREYVKGEMRMLKSKPERKRLYVVVTIHGVSLKELRDWDDENESVYCHCWNTEETGFTVSLNEIYRIFAYKKLVERR